MTDISLRSIYNLSRNTLATPLEWISSVWTVSLLIILSVWVLDPTNLVPILKISSTALLGTLPYILVAVLLIAYLKASGAEAVIARAFEGRETRMIFFAAVFGGLAPFCSCEVIPFIAGLLAVGVPLSAVMAFWLSSPLIDPPTLFITAGALGWEFAIGKAISAVALGLIGGFGIKFMLQQGAFANPLLVQNQTSCCASSCAASPFEAKPLWRFWQEQERLQTFQREGLNNFVFLLKWLTLAYLLEGLLITYVPAEFIGQFVGGEGIWPIVIGAIVGAPAYLNSYAAPALVAGLIEQGMSAGSAMAFMTSGAVSSIPAMAAVYSLVKKQVFAAYLFFGIGGAIVIGTVFGSVVG